ncbi:radical SAM family heme chaperone HemW [Chryseolinea sp. H1M3-3]|uniref:radical SAM family heme chaperone HemW n=1 Tax=Chryseolinea sp. H1M3-3 TaxID=3034144 RepID=UPI0023EBA894|nr:radical SAM family heme chaperone HemW [Chryseolinea sp. H1M3-3]
MAGIYIHIPFCKQACHYCDFHFSTNTRKKLQVLEGIATEIALQQNYLAGEQIDTIYFGGGTPSLLSAEALDRILKVIEQTFEISASAEITLEGNPDDLDFEKLKELKNIGINRLSIGIQSFDNAVLKFLNRAHDTTTALASFHNARKLGFQNISIDLMYAIPGQNVEEWRNNIQQAIELNPEHISSYALTVEEKTVFGKWAARNKIKIIDNDVSAEEMVLLIDALEGAGYHHYEVSNFSKPGSVSKHNSSYWKGEKYLGVGPSAHSYDGGSRQYNISNNHLYLNSIQLQKIPAIVEPLTLDDKINDYLLTRLRTSWGADLKKLLQDYQYDLLKLHGDYVSRLVDHKHALLSNETLILTKSGRLLADKIAADLFSMTCM